MSDKTESLVEKIMGRKAIESFPPPDPDMSDEEKVARWKRVRDTMRTSGMRDILEFIQYAKAEVHDQLGQAKEPLTIMQLHGQSVGVEALYKVAQMIEGEGIMAEAAMKEKNRSGQKEPEEDLDLPD